MSLAYPSKKPDAIDLSKFIQSDIKNEEIINEFLKWKDTGILQPSN